MIVVTGRPQQAVHTCGHDRQPPSGAIFRLLPSDELIDLLIELNSVVSAVRAQKVFFYDFDLIW